MSSRTNLFISSAPRTGREVLRRFAEQCGSFKKLEQRRLQICRRYLDDTRTGDEQAIPTTLDVG
jgi:hypothetical protein